MKPLKTYENATDIVDLKIFQGDEITFSVLTRIVNNGCKKVLTDGERVVIACSLPVYPVWVWTKADVTDEEIACIRLALTREFPLEQGFSYNLSYELWEKLGLSGNIQTNMLTYRLDECKEFPKPCGGSMRLAKESDIPVVNPWYCDLEHIEPSQGEEKLKQKIEEGTLFVWSKEETPVSMAAFIKQENGYATVNAVATDPNERRKGYCRNLVYRICQKLKEEGFTPILYADADYPASNGCYRKIGFQQVGSLCNVTK